MDINYVYNAKVVKWVDGDTVDLMVDLGFKIYHEMRLRLIGLDTPERGQAGYNEARMFDESLAPVGNLVQIQTFKPQKADKYGRYLVYIESNGVSINAELLSKGLAVPYDGGTKL
jgi:micrococcal nuclease